MPGDVNDPQRGDQQRDDGKQRHFEKQRQRNRQAQLYQTLDDGEIRFAEALGDEYRALNARGAPRRAC
jgi:hypothetical protein